MIRLVPRETALKNRTFGSYIHKCQTSLDPTDEEYMSKEGYYTDWEINTKRYYTQEECDKIREEQIVGYNQIIDSIESIPLGNHNELIYNVRKRDAFVYSVKLGEVIDKLSKFIQSDFCFMLEIKYPWLSQENNYTPVKKALDYLGSLGINDGYVGAIMANGDDLQELTTNLFWIIRCNAALPNCWFSDRNNEFVGDLCMHGNFHFHIYNKELKSRIQDFSKKNNLKRIYSCQEEFEDDNEFGGINGRETMI